MCKACHTLWLVKQGCSKSTAHLWFYWVPGQPCNLVEYSRAVTANSLQADMGSVIKDQQCSVLQDKHVQIQVSLFLMLGANQWDSAYCRLWVALQRSDLLLSRLYRACLYGMEHKTA